MGFLLPLSASSWHLSTGALVFDTSYYMYECSAGWIDRKAE